MDDLIQATIDDFGDQWGRYTANDGHYGSADYFADILRPVLKPQDYVGRRVLEIGSGTGRITRMLIEAGAAHVYAVEPATAAFAVLKTNTADLADRITYLNCRGDELPEGVTVDDVISIGVIHHIAAPDLTVAASYRVLRPGGRCLYWLYGYEGNELYLRIFGPLRRLTTRLPHFLLAGLCHSLTVAVDVYIFLCRFLKLPMRDYVRSVLMTMARNKRYLIIYDQLNPAYAKYYKQEEARDLLAQHGFKDLQLYHRHAYSWTVLGHR